jgi:hypothetical protein
MTRARLAIALGVLAALAVAATAALAVATYVGDDERATAVLVVTDPGTGARFEVPGESWEVRGPRSRIFYADDRGRPTAVVSGAAVYRDGYCAEQPGDSNRGFAGFTEQGFGAWRASLGEQAGVEHRDAVVLADGAPATLRWVRFGGGSGPCAATGVELAMVTSTDVSVVLVADAGEPGTLSHDEIVRILTGLRAS